MYRVLPRAGPFAALAPGGTTNNCENHVDPETDGLWRIFPLYLCLH